MPKISKTTASSHYDFPGYMESFESVAGQWNVAFERYGVDADLAPLLAFTPVEDTQWQESVMMPNLPAFANSLGVELPEEIKQMMSGR